MLLLSLAKLKKNFEKILLSLAFFFWFLLSLAKISQNFSLCLRDIFV